MSRPPLDDARLLEAVRSAGYRPGRADIEPLFERLGRKAGDGRPIRTEAVVEAAERALARLGLEAAEAAMARFDASEPPARARLVRLVGRIALERPSEGRGAIDAFLLARLDDGDPKARRAAIVALGKLDVPGAEAPLLARFVASSPPPPPELRALAAALGRLGGPAALAALDRARTEDRELDRILDEARLRLRRTLGRREPEGLGAIDPRAKAPGPLRVLLHARAGLARLVAEELGPAFAPRVLDDATVEATLRGELHELHRARTALRFGFPLPSAPADDPGEALVSALTSDAALAVLRAFTRGPLRYRIEWASAGRRRGLTYRVARATADARPELVNDPRESLWEAVVDEPRGPRAEGGARAARPIRIELWPRGLDDPRFAYRKAHVPASSHPTIAAALARVGEAREDDVVWDPFVGAGTELVERAKLGPYRSMLGTDLDPEALERARLNLDAAGLSGVELRRGDARELPLGARPTLILTNPPMGRRVLDKTKTGPLYDAFLARAASVLAPGGRLVWISPRPSDTARRAAAVGLRCALRQKVDMGGFFAELQRFERDGSGSVSSRRTR
jgi:precorrin-6B methylase 2